MDDSLPLMENMRREDMGMPIDWTARYNEILETPEGTSDEARIERC
jgi:hypothetical protein